MKSLFLQRRAAAYEERALGRHRAVQLHAALAGRHKRGCKQFCLCDWELRRDSADCSALVVRAVLQQASVALNSISPCLG